MSDEKRVLIVDDEADAIEFVTAVLEDIGGIAIESAGDGHAGVAKAKEVLPDLIIMDVEMPEWSGFHAFLDIRQNESTSHIPIVMLTGISEKVGIKFSGADMEEYMGEEPEAFLEKPVEPAELEKTVRDLLGLKGA